MRFETSWCVTTRRSTNLKLDAIPMHRMPGVCQLGKRHISSVAPISIEKQVPSAKLAIIKIVFLICAEKNAKHSLSTSNCKFYKCIRCKMARQHSQNVDCIFRLMYSVLLSTFNRWKIKNDFAIEIVVRRSDTKDRTALSNKYLHLI